MMNEKNIARALKMACGECHNMTYERVNLRGVLELDGEKIQSINIEKDFSFVQCKVCGNEPVHSGAVGEKEQFIEEQIKKALVLQNVRGGDKT